MAIASSTDLSSSILGEAKTLSAALADRICEQIINDKLVPGTHLGTEAKLAEQYGVSRTVVREAIGSLRGLGVVTGRQRRGLSVAQGDIQSVLKKVLTPRAAGENGWMELGRFRMVIELGSLPLAVEHATAAQIERLQTLSAEMRALLNLIEVDPTSATLAFVEKDVLFHETILEAADSDLVAQFHQMLTGYFRSNQQILAPPNLRMANEHEAIVEAIVNRDVMSSIEQMVKHLQPVIALTELLSDSEAEAPDA